MSLQFETFSVTPLRQNCTLLWDDADGRAVLTDVGGDVPVLLEAVAQKGLSVEGIWLTHGHLDHVGGVVEFLSHHDVPVTGPHPADAFLIEALPQMTEHFGFPFSPAFTPSRWLAEGDTLTLCGHRFDVLHIPGHSPGHVVFHCAAQKLLIAGDVLFYETVGRTDFPYGSHDDLIRNIREKLLVLPEDTRVLPGHGRPTVIGHEKRHNPFL